MFRAALGSPRNSKASSRLRVASNSALQEPHTPKMAESTALQSRLDTLNQQITALTSALPPDSRKLVTGHESMGYFSARYGFTLIGALVPSLSDQADVSAADLAALKQDILSNGVGAIFTELGTSAVVINQIGKETGARVVQLSTHVLPADGSYFTFETNLAQTIVDGLK